MDLKKCDSESSLGNELRALRIDKGLSQQQLGDILKISRKKVGAIENEKEATMDVVEMKIIRQWVKACNAHNSKNSKKAITQAVLKFLFD